MSVGEEQIKWRSANVYAIAVFLDVVSRSRVGQRLQLAVDVSDAHPPIVRMGLVLCQTVRESPARRSVRI